MKHLTKTLAVISLLAPVTALPLGIGDIELHSALNQKLNAEIKLHLAPGENPEDIVIRMAAPEQFDKAGIPWNYVLSKIKFNRVVRPNGSVSINVSSREVISEPFVDFLVEVSWPQGNQYREFTLLLDPPSGYHPPELPDVADNRIQIEALPKRPVAPRVHRPATTKARPKVAAHISTQTPTSGEYGPTQRADTLWEIAKKLGEQRGVPQQQMMYALFNANPDAFIQGDINALKIGETLKIPETDAILQKTGKRPTQQAPEKIAAKSLELEAPVDAQINDNAQINEQSQPGGSPESSVADGTVSTTGGEDALTLQNRIDRLEQQLNMMQQLLTLKDQQLAALQSGDQTPPPADQVPQPADQTQTLEPKPAPTQQPGQQTVQPVPADKKPIPPAQPKPPIKPTPVAQPPQEEGFFSSSAYYLTVGGFSVGILGLLGWLWWRNRKMEELSSTDSMFASASQIKLPDSDSSLSVPVMDMSTAGSYDVGTVGESSFISDFTPSDFEAFDTDQGEVDPMSEADVYLAYGRYQQAEDLMRRAIEDHPDKDEYKLKLLEIFYANENKDRFGTYAEELAASGKNNDQSFWTKVTDMGKEIMPESPLFGGQPAASQPAPSPQQETTAEADNFGQEDFTALSDQSPSEQAKNQTSSNFPPELDEADNSSLDFDLSLFAETEPAKDNKPEEATADIEAIDFDLGNLGDEAAAKTSAQTSESTNDALDSFDFNFDFDMDSESVEKPASNQAQATNIDLEATTDNFNFDLGVDDSSSDEFDLGVSDLTDMDEFETKIDLAKAYIDMGDSAAAKAIAEEVLAKGNPEQQQAAQAILNEIE